MRLCILWVCICLLGGILSYAQTGDLRAVEGFVRDSMGQPVEMANVLLVSKQTGGIIRYDHTNEAGFFQFFVPADSTNFLLRAIAMGYKNAEQPYLQGKSMRYDFVLKPTDFALQNVVIRGKAPPIRHWSDTTEWRVRSFSDSTENTVEDILRKLPGVEVTEQGAVKVNGKFVEKILVEGDDLFGSNYTLASRNIRANHIATIQALDHHQSNPALRNIKKSDALVLNLVLEEGRKVALSGNFTGGLGTGGGMRYYAQSNLFSFSKRFKTIALAHTNNTGYDALSDVEFFLQGGTLEGLAERRALEANQVSLLTLPQTQNFGLADGLVRQNRSTMATISHLRALGNGWKLKAQVMAFQDRLAQTNYSQQLFYLPSNASFRSIENQQTIHKQRVGSAQIGLEHLATNQRNYFKGLVEYRPAHNKYAVGMTRQVNDAPANRIQQSVNDELHNLRQHAEYTCKVNEKTAYQFEAQSQLLWRNQRLAAQWEAYRSFMPHEKGPDSLVQFADQRRYTFKVLGRWITNRRTGQWSLESGFSNQWQSAYTSVAPSLVDPEGTDPFNNYIRLNRPAPYCLAAWRKSFKKMEMSVQHEGLFVNAQVKGDTLINTPLLLSMPRFRLLYNFNEAHTWIVRANYLPQIPNSESLLSHYVWTNYQNAQRGLTDQRPTIRRLVEMVYRYRNEQKVWFANAGIHYQDQLLDFGQQFRIDSNFSFGAAFRPIQTQQWAAHGQVDKFVDRISTRFALSWVYQQMRSANQVNNDLGRRLLSRNQSLSVNCGTALPTWTNFFFTSAYSQQHTLTMGEMGNQNTNATTWRHQLRTVFKPRKQLSMEATLQYNFNIINGLATQKVWLLNGKMLIFAHKNKRHQLSLEAHNLLNARVFEQVMVTDFVSLLQGIHATPRFVLLTYEWPL